MICIFLSTVVRVCYKFGLTCGVPDGVLDSSVGDDGRGGEPLAGPGRAVALKWWKDFFVIQVAGARVNAAVCVG